jgi:hypothetical protein
MACLQHLRVGGYFFALFFCFAQRALCAAAIFSRANADIGARVFLMVGAAFGLPGPRLVVVSAASKLLACCKRIISASSCAMISWVFMTAVYRT